MYHLPPELWLQVFHWATLSRAHLTHYVPFQMTSGLAYEDDTSLSVGKTLVLVCRQWRALAKELLYKNLVIQGNIRALQFALAQRAEHDSEVQYGKLVRRVVLPYSSTTTEPTAANQTPWSEVLKLCSRMEDLVRPLPNLTERNALRFEFETVCPSFVSLRRLEWWYTNNASRSGGINRLEDVLKMAPNLQYLFVGVMAGYFSTHISGRSERITLCSLHILHLRVHSAAALYNITRWSLPALTHLILDSPLTGEALNLVWDKFGSTLQKVEFGKHLGFVSENYTASCLKHCTNLLELNYHILFVAPPPFLDDGMKPKPVLRSVGLHLSPNRFLTTNEMWIRIGRHLTEYTSPRYPHLEKISLFGDWSSVVSNDQFESMRRKVYECGCSFELLRP